MATILWIGGGALGLYIAWWAIKLIATIVVPAERSGAALFKKYLVKAGIDVRQIPNEAIDEIIRVLMKRSKATAFISSLSNNMPNERNWRANLVRQIQAHIGLVCESIRFGPERYFDDEIVQILIKYSIVNTDNK